MEDRKLEAAESLALIGRMIENTRSRMVRNSGRPLLAWGYATVLTTLAVWGAVLYFQDPRWNYLWLMLPLLGWLLMWVSREKKPEGEVRTFVDRVIGNVWTVMGLSAWFVSMLALFTPMRLPILFIILLIMGMGTTVTGLIIRFTPTAVGGVSSTTSRTTLPDNAMFKELNPLLHSELRLAVVSILIGVESADFVFIRQQTGATAGNLSVQLDKLAKAGYIEVEKTFRRKIPCTVCRITDAGRDAFADYVEALQSYIKR